MLITKFYENYLAESDEETNPSKEMLMDLLQSEMDNEQLIQAESMITELEDSSAEKAFTAGFKTAFNLLVEVLA